MTGVTDFAGMVPGFDFLQNLMKGAGSGLPQINQWIAPTLDPAELEKRIQDLKTVQFWLEQNTRLLGTTIQALEVQRMTLNTLKTMNLPLADLGAALRMSPPAPVPAAPAPTAPEPAPEALPKAQAQTPAAGVDPVQWWGALTQQFTEIAQRAMQDSPPPWAPGQAPARAPAPGKAARAPAKPPAKRSRAAAPKTAAAKRSRG